MIVNFINPYTKNILIPASETSSEKWKAIYTDHIEMSWEDLVQYAMNPKPVPEKTKAWGWNFEILTPNITYPDPRDGMKLKLGRVKKNTIAHALVVLDADKNVDMQEFIKRNFRFPYIIHSTANCKSDYKKYRILIPIVEPLKFDSKLVFVLLNYFKFMNLDRTCLEDSRFFFCPSVTPETYYEYHIQAEGNLFNPLIQFKGQLEQLEREERARELHNRVMEKMKPKNNNLQGALKWCEKQLDEFTHLPSDSGHDIHTRLLKILAWYKNKAGGDPKDLIRFCRDHKDEAETIADSLN